MERAIRRLLLPAVVALMARVCMSALQVQTNESVAGTPDTYQIKRCYTAWGWGTFPLRYGNRRFGYRHIRARHGWSRRMDRQIRRTLLSGFQELTKHRVVFRRYRGSWDGGRKRGTIPNGNGNLGPYCTG